MNKTNIKAYIWVIVLSTILIWALVLLSFDIKLEGSIDAVKKLPLVVTIEALLWLIFTAWGWKLRIFQSWLIVEPIIEGTWTGNLVTTWMDPDTGESPDPIPIVLTIIQSFYKISCSIYSNESTSNSYSAIIYNDTDSGAHYFIYSYTNKPKASVRDRSEFHDGTAKLRIIGGSQSKIEGDYWTTRKSTGDMELAFHSKRLVTSYDEVNGA